MVAQLGVFTGLQHGGVVRREHVGDARTVGPQRDGRVGVDPFGAQPLHLGAPFVKFDGAVGGALCIRTGAGVPGSAVVGWRAVRGDRRLVLGCELGERCLAARGVVVLRLVSRCGHIQTILSSGLPCQAAEQDLADSPATAD